MQNLALEVGQVHDVAVHEAPDYASAVGDPGVFVRSMAARERLGGISDAARAAVAILAPVFDHVFVETVGVGQSESDVISIVDTLVFVASPGSGDVLQFIKAGLIELPDIYVVNKADLGEPATRTAHELTSALGLDELPHAGTYDTLAGFMMVMLRRIPRRTDRVEYAGFRFEVLDVDDYKIDQVLVTCLLAQPPAAAAAAA